MLVNKQAVASQDEIRPDARVVKSGGFSVDVPITVAQIKGFNLKYYKMPLGKQNIRYINPHTKEVSPPLADDTIITEEVARGVQTFYSFW